MLARLGAFQQVAIDELAGEPDPDPAARNGLDVQPGRDEVIEGTVEVSQGDVHGNPGDGQPFAHRLVLRPLRHGSVLPERAGRLRQRQGEVAAEAKHAMIMKGLVPQGGPVANRGIITPHRHHWSLPTAGGTGLCALTPI